MKRFILTLTSLCIITCGLSAQSLNHEDFDGYDDVEHYYMGALSISKALTANAENRKFYFEDAIRYLSPIRDESGTFINRYQVLDLVSIDVAAAMPVNGKQIYTYEYARQQYNDAYFKEEMLLRQDKATTRAKCRVKMLAMKPRSKVSYKDIMEGKSILIAMAEPGGTLRLTVSSDIEHEGLSYENGMVGFCKWIAKEEEEVVYHIENTSNKEICLILIAN